MLFGIGNAGAVIHRLINCNSPSRWICTERGGMSPIGFLSEPPYRLFHFVWEPPSADLGRCATLRRRETKIAEEELIMSNPVVLITGGFDGDRPRPRRSPLPRMAPSVVVSGRREDAGRALVSELRALGAEAEFIKADVRHEDDVRALVDGAVARFGRMDAAINIAGTEGKPGPATAQTAETYAATFETNVLGTILSMKRELRVMQAQRTGSIVNISSAFGHEGAPGASVYAASKHAVESLTRSAALEAAPFGVRVNAVAPGAIETGMLDRFTGTAENKAALASEAPLARLGEPSEIAQAIIFAASSRSSFMTGHILAVDGGRAAR